MNFVPQQPTLRPCPECGGRRVAGKTAHDLVMKAELRTASGHPLNVIVPAVVCIFCGYISLFTSNQATLQEELQKQPDHYRY